MLIFLDTEFTDFLNCDLISIGMVSADDRQFYGERNDFEIDWCNSFVHSAVLPQLGKNPENIYSKDRLKESVIAWLNQFKDSNPTICFDYSGDWHLLVDLLDDYLPSWLRGMNVYERIDDLVFEHNMLTLFQGAQHHALHDAICNKLAFRA